MVIKQEQTISPALAEEMEEEESMIHSFKDLGRVDWPWLAKSGHVDPHPDAADAPTDGSELLAELEAIIGSPKGPTEIK